jgi:hypothetical protein
MRRFSLVVALLIVPVIAQGQVRGGGGVHTSGGGVAHATISAPRSFAGGAPTIRSAPRPGGTTVFRGAPGRIVASGSRGTAISRPANRAVNPSAFDQQGSLPDFTGVPGLGFDYAHLAAIHPGGIGGQRDRRNNFRNNGFGFFPFFDSGFLLPYEPSYVTGQADDSYVTENQPQVNTDSDPGGQTGEQRAPHYALQTATAPYDVVVTPPKQSEQYVFVRRDGTVFFAVAYSWESGKLDYITLDGTRRSVAREMLDLDATQQFNEQRGLTFQAPTHAS